jgi:hypothetical protein
VACCSGLVWRKPSWQTPIVLLTNHFGLDYESQIEMHELFLRLREPGKTLFLQSQSLKSAVSEKPLVGDGKLRKNASSGKR